MPMFEKPSPPIAPCRLGHHNIGHEVCWTEGFQRLRGVVMGHKGDQRFITIQVSDGQVRVMPCGGVAKAGAR